MRHPRAMPLPRAPKACRRSWRWTSPSRSCRALNRRMHRAHQARRHDRGDGPRKSRGRRRPRCARPPESRTWGRRPRGSPRPTANTARTPRSRRVNSMRDAAIMSGRESSHHRPRVHRDHDAGGGLGDAEARSDIGQAADGHELRGIEHERRERQARKRHPLSRCHACLFARSAGVVRPDSPARAPHIHTPLRIDPLKRLAPHDTGPAEQPIDYRGPTVDPRT